MKQAHRLIWIVLLIALLIPTSAVFAKELAGLDVSGPGINGTLRLDDMDDVRRIEESGFMGYGTRSMRLSDEEISELGEGYRITFLLFMEDSTELFPVETVIYYPDPEGGAGYMNWLGGGDVGVQITSSSRWSRTEGGEDIFREVLAAQGVVIGAAQPAAVSEGQPEVAAVAVEAPVVESEAVIAETPSQPSMLWGWMAGSVAAIFGIGSLAVWMLRRPKLSPSPAGQD